MFCSPGHCHLQGINILPLLFLAWISHEQFPGNSHLLYPPLCSDAHILNFLSQLAEDSPHYFSVLCFIHLRICVFLWNHWLVDLGKVVQALIFRQDCILSIPYEWESSLWSKGPHRRDTPILLDNHLPMWFCQWLNSWCDQWAQGQSISWALQSYVFILSHQHCQYRQKFKLFCSVGVKRNSQKTVCSLPHISS